MFNKLIIPQIKKQKTGLDVDFIGGQGPLTAEEEKLISEFLKKSKTVKAPKAERKIRASKSTKKNA